MEHFNKQTEKETKLDRKPALQPGRVGEKARTKDEEVNQNSLGIQCIIPNNS